MPESLWNRLVASCVCTIGKTANSSVFMVLKPAWEEVVSSEAEPKFLCVI